jgi:hypothetical protein
MSAVDQAAQQRAEAREKVAADARRGVIPSVAYQLTELQWAFADHMDELEHLEQEAHDRRAREHEAGEASIRRHAVERETERVLAEWDAERRAKAEAEARRRLSEQG